MISYQSLTQYLNQRYIIVLALVSALFITLIIVMNRLGMDDTSEYYMLYEAEVLTEYYQPYAQIIEFDPGKKEYYWGHSQLPEKYQMLIKDVEPVANKVSLYVTDINYIYLLPYKLLPEKLTFYVIHIFPVEDAYADHSLRQLLTLGGALFLVLVIYFVFCTNKQVTTQVLLLDNYMRAITLQSTEQSPDLELPEKLSFRELRAAAACLQQSMQAQHELRQKEQEFIVKEKAFLSTLSHELRTPISVISAAIALLKKRNQLTAQDVKVLEKLAKANNNIQLITETLLQLWRRQKSLNPPSEINVTTLLEQLINSCDADYSSNINFTVNGIENEVIVADRVLLELTLANLLRNACQYSIDANVSVTVNHNAILISNAINDDLPKDEINYGYGLGFYLVEAICQQQGWQLSVTRAEPYFNVALSFSSK